VFDDVMLEKQSPIEKYFSQGRHGNADCFYLCQSYFRIPKQAIRDNANLIILFTQDAKIYVQFTTHLSAVTWILTNSESFSLNVLVISMDLQS
jgi:hypothetical protein